MTFPLATYANASASVPLPVILTTGGVTYKAPPSMISIDLILNPTWSYQFFQGYSVTSVEPETIALSKYTTSSGCILPLTSIRCGKSKSEIIDIAVSILL